MGVGVHSNVKVSMTLWPAEPDTGVVFRRTDLPGGETEIKAVHSSVVDTTLCTTLGDGNGLAVATIEHLMAALAGSGIDNVVVELDGPEVPAMDGSSAPFVFLIECAGSIEQAAPRRAVKVLKNITVTDGERWVSISPSDRFSLQCEITFRHHLITDQAYHFDSAVGSFKNELCRARTFCFEEDVERMRAAGLAMGGSLDNAIVVGEAHVLNDDGLRYDDEFVRHKTLDCIGDLYLAGGPLLAHVHSVRAGHRLNNQLLTALFDDREAWQQVTLDAPTPRVAEPTPRPRYAVATG
jgi:UDP-3-O-[3-hydroxymyristoyl] N-acetylglucosamine deacetylase